MNQPLAPAVGNALEVDAAMRVLSGQDSGRLAEMTAVLGGLSLAGAGLAADAVEGAEKIIEALSSGRAVEHFGKMIAAMGGPLRFVEEWQRFLPEATVIRELTARETGYVSAMNGEAIGLAVIGLGGGRQVESDRIESSVGLSDVVPLGTWVDKGAPLLRIHAARVDHAQAAETILRQAIVLAEDAPGIAPLIYEQVG